MDNLISAVFEGVSLAAEGHVANGYQVLLLGKQQALEGQANSRGPRISKDAGTRRWSDTRIATAWAERDEAR